MTIRVRRQPAAIHRPGLRPVLQPDARDVYLVHRRAAAARWTANGLFTAPANGSGATYVQATSTVNGVTVSGQGYAILMQPPVVTSIGANPVNGVSTSLTVNAYDPQGENLSFFWSVAAQPAGATALPRLAAADQLDHQRQLLPRRAATRSRSRSPTIQPAVTTPRQRQRDREFGPDVGRGDTI